VEIDEGRIPSPHKGADLIALDDALNALTAFDPRQARVVELRFFAGLSEEEAAEVLGISSRTVKRDWAMAKAWLAREMAHGVDS
jgi:RNA polymerase sigma factor (TIGR02999 family)